MCALDTCFMSVCVLVFVFAHEWVECTRGIVEQGRDLAGVGGGGSGGGCPPLLSPVFTQLWGSCLAHWLRNQDIQDQLREGERKKRILTHFNTGDRWKGAAQRKLKPAVSLSGWRKKGSAALMTVERGAERKRVCGGVAGTCPNQH